MEGLWGTASDTPTSSTPSKSHYASNPKHLIKEKASRTEAKLQLTSTAKQTVCVLDQQGNISDDISNDKRGKASAARMDTTHLQGLPALARALPDLQLQFPMYTKRPVWADPEFFGGLYFLQQML